MSVAQLTAGELGTFAAIVTHLKLTDFMTACRLAERIAAGNRRAFESQYSEFIDQVTADDVEREALPLLARPAELVDRHFSPLAYNMIANDRTAFDENGETTQDLLMSLDLRAIEEACYKWQEGQQREKRRREEDDRAFVDVEPPGKLSGEELARRCAAAKCDRIIYAEFRVDQSDPYTDYHGGRSVRTVCIGFGKGKRENFKQLRKAAGQFPPTADFGPGKGVFRPRVVLTNDAAGGSGLWKGSYSPWHRDLTEQDGSPIEFLTREEAEAFIAEKGDPDPVICHGGEEARFEWKICEEDIEHRENYSMGGGNYLGRDRYSGWQVSSRPVSWGCSEMEFFEPPRRTARPKAPAKTPDRSGDGPISHGENSRKPAEPVGSAVDYAAWL